MSTFGDSQSTTGHIPKLSALVNLALSSGIVQNDLCRSFLTLTVLWFYDENNKKGTLAYWWILKNCEQVFYIELPTKFFIRYWNSSDINIYLWIIKLRYGHLPYDISLSFSYSSLQTRTYIHFTFSLHTTRPIIQSLKILRHLRHCEF